MDVVIFKARGRGGYIYDMSINPLVDFSILKRTRKIDKIEVITPKISIEKAEIILKSIYGVSSIIGKLISSQDYMINNILRKNDVKKIKYEINNGIEIPSPQKIASVEEIIVGKILSLEKLLGIKDKLGITSEEMTIIIQTLYCQRRIKMTCAIHKVKNKHTCFICNREPCPSCTLGIEKDDILVYAADNYSISIPENIILKDKRLSDVIKDAQNDFTNFLKSKKLSCVIWCAPSAFEYDIVSTGVFNIIRRGGRVLYITSTAMAYSTKEFFGNNFYGAKVGIVTNVFSRGENLDITICSYDNYPCFYKSFDLVILDVRYSFIYRPMINTKYVCPKAAKEKGKFVTISYVVEKEKNSLINTTTDPLILPVTYIKKPIPEPRIITSRYLKSPEAFIPQMAMDLINWSISEGIRVVIFVPDEEGLYKVYFYLSTLEGFEKDSIDVSDEDEKAGLLRFKRKESKILISKDFKDTLHLMEDVNVVVMFSDEGIYSTETLIYMSSMATMQNNKKLGEVVFVATQESEAMSLAKSAIRNLNKIAWDKGYLKK
ncbi:hypothetical protein Q428_00760 [Fervidicella metallireducens AeB]|uniref:Uncharacterized protein n=1 Tax=Fervidicella metallireducens AeB TaxID=1403537 RepID=A0A017RYN0_9CLOT|nr:hypothetical protein [Fervidicella metallireducens]EYE89888.1 hypothetical protein Q428_00760 [Fervidicella metallireducens AeB]